MRIQIQKLSVFIIKSADLCSDTLPQNGPTACLPGEPQHKVKLKLKEGEQIRSKKPYHIPESYREDL